MTDIVVIGAGPVGLWTAIQLKKRWPAAAICIYERHATYQRSHVLRLDHWSLLLYGRINRAPNEERFYQAVTGYALPDVQKRFAASLFIRTQDLESALKAYALSEGIDIRQGFIRTPTQIEALHPECSCFIACDGAHSRLRKALLGEDALTAEVLHQVAELKFEETGPARALTTAELWQCNRGMACSAFEYVGQSEAGVTPATVRFFVRPQVYAALPGMTFKSPYRAPQGEWPEALRADIGRYLAFRRQVVGSQFLPESAALTKLELAVYSAKHFGLMQGNKAWFLVGDAAMAVPYFRALNCGLMLGSRLAQIVAKGMPNGVPLATLVARYERHRPWHVQTEFSIARMKAWAVDGFDAVRTVLAEEPQGD